MSSLGLIRTHSSDIGKIRGLEGHVWREQLEATTSKRSESFFLASPDASTSYVTVTS